MNNWQTEFDKLFLDLMYNDDGYSEEREALKSFITSLLSKEREAGRAQGIEEEAIGCDEHCEKARQEGRDEAVDYIEHELALGSISGDAENAIPQVEVWRWKKLLELARRGDKV